MSIHQGGNYTTYDGIEDHVDIILLAFKTFNKDVAEDHMVLRCVRATNVVEGSRVPASGSVSSMPTSMAIKMSILTGILVLL